MMPGTSRASCKDKKRACCVPVMLCLRPDGSASADSWPACGAGLLWSTGEQLAPPTLQHQHWVPRCAHAMSSRCSLFDPHSSAGAGSSAGSAPHVVQARCGAQASSSSRRPWSAGSLYQNEMRPFMCMWLVLSGPMAQQVQAQAQAHGQRAVLGHVTQISSTETIWERRRYDTKKKMRTCQPVLSLVKCPHGSAGAGLHARLMASVWCRPALRCGEQRQRPTLERWLHETKNMRAHCVLLVALCMPLMAQQVQVQAQAHGKHAVQVRVTRSSSSKTTWERRRHESKKMRAQRVLLVLFACPSWLSRGNFKRKLMASMWKRLA